MNQTDTENYIARVDQKVVNLEIASNQIKNALEVLTSNLKTLNSNTADLKGVESKIALLNRQIADLKVDYTGLDKRISRFELAPAKTKKFKWF